MNIQGFEIIQLFLTILPILGIAWKGSSMLTRLEEMVANLNTVIKELREDWQRDRAEIKQRHENHEERIRLLEKEIAIVKEDITNERK